MLKQLHLGDRQDFIRISIIEGPESFQLQGTGEIVTHTDKAMIVVCDSQHQGDGRARFVPSRDQLEELYAFLHTALGKPVQ
jgi:hypothetical protein